MLIRHPSDILPSEINSETEFNARRDWLKQAAGLGLIAGLPTLAACDAQAQGAKLAGVKPNPTFVLPDEKLNKFDELKSYCNCHRYSKKSKIRPQTSCIC